MTQAALALLNRIEGLTLLLPDEEARQTCCGFGGLFSVKVDAVSAELARRKWAALLRTVEASAQPSFPRKRESTAHIDQHMSGRTGAMDPRVKPGDDGGERGNDERREDDKRHGRTGWKTITLTGPDMGCLMHLKAWLDAHPEVAGGRTVRVRHVAEILAGEDSREHTP